MGNVLSRMPLLLVFLLFSRPAGALEMKQITCVLDRLEAEWGPHEVIAIEPCCESVAHVSGVGAADFPARDSPVDVYGTGTQGTQIKSTSPSLPRGFSYVPPRTLKAEVDLAQMTLPDLEFKKQMIEILKGLIRPDQNPRFFFSFSGEGDLSKAYFFDLDPPAEILAKLEKQGANRKTQDAVLGDWMREHARWVIKIRKKAPWRGTKADAARQLRGDIAHYGLAADTSSRAKLNGKPFIRVAKFLSSASEHSHGVLVQEASHGPSVFELKDAIDTVLPEEGAPCLMPRLCRS